MKSIMFLIVMTILCNIKGFSQADDVISEVQDSYEYYEAAFKKIKEGLYYISQCYKAEGIDDIQSYASSAEGEISSAQQYAGYAEDEADDAEDEASNIGCSDAEDEASNAEDYFYSAKSNLNSAVSELSSASYEDDIDNLSDYLSNAKNYIDQAIRALSNGVDELNSVLSELEDCSGNVQRSTSSDVTCDELFAFIIKNGYQSGVLSNYTMNSSWLKKVTAYSYDYKIYVIAEIKANEYSYTTNSYIFCGIPSSNWSSFKNGGIYDSDSYGERFHKYIFDYKCNCN